MACDVAVAVSISREREEVAAPGLHSVSLVNAPMLRKCLTSGNLPQIDLDKGVEIQLTSTALPFTPRRNLFTQFLGLNVYLLWSRTKADIPRYTTHAVSEEDL